MVTPPSAGRKVRTPQEKAPLKRRVPVNIGNGKCNRKQTASIGYSGRSNGERVV